MNQPHPGSLAVRRPVIAYRGGDVSRHDDALAVEEPLEIRMGDEPLAVTMRTGGHDDDLAAGFCLTESIIAEPDELVSVSPCREAEFGNIISVELAEEAMARRTCHIDRARRETYLTSSCGLCGKQSIDRVRQATPRLHGRFQISRATLAELPEKMRAEQSTFDQTGGLHAAGLFTVEGRLKVLREDIGRHNAVDKVIGASLLLGDLPCDPSLPAMGVTQAAATQGVAPGGADDATALVRPGAAAVLLVSGRAGFEIIQKAAMAGICVVASVSAPSSLAVDLATELGMTLVGFLRPGRMNVYHDPGRLVE